MRAKETFEIGLRLLSFWTLLAAIGQMALLAGLVHSSGPGDIGVILPACISTLAYSTLSAGCFLFAPSIASWLYGTQLEYPHEALHEGQVPDIHHVAVSLLGLYALLSAVKPASKLADASIDFALGDVRLEDVDRAGVIECVAYVVFGILCVLKAGPIAHLFGKGQEGNKKGNTGEGNKSVGSSFR